MARKSFILCAALVVVASYGVLMPGRSALTEPTLLALFGVGLAGVASPLHRKDADPVVNGQLPVPAFGREGAMQAQGRFQLATDDRAA